MNIFETVKATISVRQAAEYYGLKLSSNNMVCCPFHNDRTPSMKLNEDYFYCFGCGSKGDVIDFVARLFGLTSLQAAKKLAYDFGIDPDKPPAAAALQKSKYSLARAFQRKEMDCQRILCDYLYLLERWKVQYAPKTSEDTIDDRFVEAYQMLDYIEHLTDILTFAELEVRIKTVDMLRKDGTNINEALFCDDFLGYRKIIFANGAFFTPDGRVTDDLPLRGEIYEELKCCAVNNIPRKITNILEVMKLAAHVEDFPPEADRIHLANGTLKLDGSFTEGRPDIVRSRLPVAYCPRENL